MHHAYSSQPALTTTTTLQCYTSKSFVYRKSGIESSKINNYRYIQALMSATSGTLAEQHESSQHAYGGTMLLLNEILMCIKTRLLITNRTCAQEDDTERRERRSYGGGRK